MARGRTREIPRNVTHAPPLLRSLSFALLRPLDTHSFDLSREVVAISLDLFDRFLATRNNVCNGNTALLVSLTTLHISIKLHDRKKIKIATLANLSRGQFGVADIEGLEWTVLAALGWKLHPPTQVSFVHHLLQLLPLDVHSNSTLRRDVNELSRYLTELAVCDSYFIDVHNSTVALAAILNVLDQISFTRLPAGVRERFLRNVLLRVGLNHRDVDIVTARERLRAMLHVTGTGSENQAPLVAAGSVPMENDFGSISSASGSNGSSYTNKEMRTSYYQNRPRANSSDSSQRSARRLFMANISPSTRAQRSSSPIVAGIQ